MLSAKPGPRIIPPMSTPAPVLAETTARARQILEQRGIRPTSQRMKVAEILLTTPRHLTAEQILATLRESSGHVSKATVYNTLNLFVEQGLAREIHADPERCVYDSTMVPHHHFQNDSVLHFHHSNLSICYHQYQECHIHHLLLQSKPHHHRLNRQHLQTQHHLSIHHHHHHNIQNQLFHCSYHHQQHHLIHLLWLHYHQHRRMILLLVHHHPHSHLLEYLQHIPYQ